MRVAAATRLGRVMVVPAECVSSRLAWPDVRYLGTAPHPFWNFSAASYSWLWLLAFASAFAFLIGAFLLGTGSLHFAWSHVAELLVVVLAPCVATLQTGCGVF